MPYMQTFAIKLIWQVMPYMQTFAIKLIWQVMSNRLWTRIKSAQPN